MVRNKLTPEVRDERARALGVVGFLIDSTLEEWERAEKGSTQEFFLATFAADLARLGRVIREGGDSADLAQLISEQAPG